MKTPFQARHQRICRPARGFGIVTAVFLLVVLAGLGAALVNLTTV